MFWFIFLFEKKSQLYFRPKDFTKNVRLIFALWFPIVHQVLYLHAWLCNWHAAAAPAMRYPLLVYHSTCTEHCPRQVCHDSPRICQVWHKYLVSSRSCSGISIHSACSTTGLNSTRPTQVVRQGKLDPRSDPARRSGCSAKLRAITLFNL